MALSPKQVAAEFINKAIHDVICDSDKALAWEARQWLHLDDYPSKEEILEPDPLGFIAASIKLGLNWRELRKTIMEALEIEEKPYLTLVHRGVPMYNSIHEGQEDFNRKITS